MKDYMLNFTRNGKPQMMKRAYAKKAPDPRWMERTCPAGKMINPLTGRCVNLLRIKPPRAACPSGKMINPLTGRCINAPVPKRPCQWFQMINPKTGRCINNPVHTKPPREPRRCPAGKMINPKTGRCINVRVSAKKSSPPPKYMLDFLSNGKPQMMRRTYTKKKPLANNWMLDYHR